MEEKNPKLFINKEKKKKREGVPQGTKKDGINARYELPETYPPQTHTLTHSRTTKLRNPQGRKTRADCMEWKAKWGVVPWALGRGRGTPLAAQNRADGKPVEFLVWVSSSQQPKLMDFNVLSCVGSCPLSSQVWDGPTGSPDGPKIKTSRAKNTSREQKPKKSPRGFLVQPPG